jgi:hypothetical protein
VLQNWDLKSYAKASLMLADSMVREEKAGNQEQKDDFA